jgi:pilus assembly protein CpaB
MVAKNALSHTQKQSAGPVQKVVPVVVAKGAIRAGSALKADDIAMGSVSGEAAPQGSFANANDLVGRVVNVPLVPGQAIMANFLAPPGSKPGLQAIVPNGMRAVTFEINETSGVAGFLLPGCHVDVVTTIQDPDSGGSIARTVVQNVEITAIGNPAPPPSSDSNAPAPQIRSVTLLCTAKDAEAVELASATGRPRLVLRGGLDQDPSSTEGVTLTELRGKATGGKNDPFSTFPTEMTQPTTKPATVIPAVDEKPAAQAREKQTYERTVKIIRGTSESSVVFELPRRSTGLMSGTDEPQDKR